MASEKLCPICETRNEDTALVCITCGTSLEGDPTDLVAITEYVGWQPNAAVEDAATFIDAALIPEGGVGIHIAGAPKPYYVPIYRELIIGRQVDAALEAVLDLSDLDAFNMGVSRRHAMLRRAEFGFEVLDLSSRNGTWLNGKQLVPNRPYPFASGSQLRLGRMQLLIVYPVPGQGTQKK
jgi:FHA domain-containing protein